jgi:hypothetical protein
MLAFYDELRRRDQTVQRFEALLTERLDSSIDDRGAVRMLQQTRFLAAAFRGYRRRLDEGAAGADEHTLRERLLTDAGERPLRRLIVTMGDRACEPAGLWVADFDLMARMPGIEEIDLIATEAMLIAGWHERLHAVMPGIEEVDVSPDDAAAASSAAGPVLRAPARDVDRRYFVARDREDELGRIARALKAERRASPSTFDPDRHAIVFTRPLPYLYLARTVFGAAGIPYQAADAVPLAAEPYAAALDLVFSCVNANGARLPAVALLRSPHFQFAPDDERHARDVVALDRALAEAGYLGEVDALERLVNEWDGGTEVGLTASAEATAVKKPDTTYRNRAARGGKALTAVLRELLPLASPAPVASHLTALSVFPARAARLSFRSCTSRSSDSTSPRYPASASARSSAITSRPCRSSSESNWK